MRSYANQPIGTVPRARELRRNASEPEKRLLRGLRGSFPALKWRHQSPVGPFYPDILCFSEKLVIEVDGVTHANSQLYDVDRTRFLEDRGYRVLRFWNNDVMENLDGVLAQISLFFQEREGAPQARKGEDSSATSDGSDDPTLSSPFPRLTARAPSLSQGEREL